MLKYITLNKLYRMFLAENRYKIFRERNPPPPSAKCYYDKCHYFSSFLKKEKKVKTYRLLALSDLFSNCFN